MNAPARLTVPASFSEPLVARSGPAARRWLDMLPARADRILRHWSCTIAGPMMHGLTSVVVPVERADGSPAVLKLGFAPWCSASEPVALHAWNGRGAVRLLKCDDVESAMLLERLRPLTTPEPDRSPPPAGSSASSPSRPLPTLAERCMAGYPTSGSAQHGSRIQPSLPCSPRRSTTPTTSPPTSPSCSCRATSTSATSCSARTDPRPSTRTASPVTRPTTSCSCCATTGTPSRANRTSIAASGDGSTPSPTRRGWTETGCGAGRSSERRSPPSGCAMSVSRPGRSRSSARSRSGWPQRGRLRPVTARPRRASDELNRRRASTEATSDASAPNRVGRAASTSARHPQRLCPSPDLPVSLAALVEIIAFLHRTGLPRPQLMISRTRSSLALVAAGPYR